MQLITSKQDFFTAAELKTVDAKLPNGNMMRLRELTAGDRSRLFESKEDSMIRRQAMTICLACELLDEADVDSVLKMGGALIRELSDQVLEISGLGQKAEEQAEKN